MDQSNTKLRPLRGRAQLERASRPVWATGQGAPAHACGLRRLAAGKGFLYAWSKHVDDNSGLWHEFMTVSIPSYMGAVTRPTRSWGRRALDDRAPETGRVLLWGSL